MSSVILNPASAPIKGEINIPGDKSISHRAIIFASLSNKTVRLKNLLESEDVLCTIDCFRKMGVSIEKQEQDWIIVGVGLQGLKAPTETLYCGNSGTTLRLMLGLLAGQNFDSALSGDASLSRRPLGRVLDPLKQMGATFEIEGEGSAERVVRVKGKSLKGIFYSSPIASAQVKTALLLAGLFSKGFTTVSEPLLSRDHTEKMFDLCQISYSKKELSVAICRGDEINFPSEYTIPSDISSAAFFMVAALLVEASSLTLKNVGLNPSRTGLLEALKAMGAELQIKMHSSLGEEWGDVTIQTSALQSFKITKEIIPRLIDEIPIFAIAAAKAQGLSSVRDAQELKVKESNRIEGICTIYNALGVSHQKFEDGFEVLGPQEFNGGQIDAGLDHRLAMSMAIAALVAKDKVEILSSESVQSSFPNFWNLLSSLGVKVE